MLFELLVRFIIITLDGCFFDCSIHSLDLSIRPQMFDFGKPMFDFVLMTNTVEQMFERPYIFQAVSKLNAECR